MKGVRSGGSSIAILVACAAASAQGDERPGAAGGDDIALDQHGDLFPAEWSQDDTGRLMVSPDPAPGSRAASGPFIEDTPGRPLAGLAAAFAEAGPLGMLALVAHGDRDLASLADGEYLRRKLGMGTDERSIRAALGRRAGQTGAAARAGADLDRLLAVRVAQERGYASAIPALERVARDVQASGLLRWAAREAVTAILSRRGASANPRAGAPEPRPLAEALVGLPADRDVLARIDHRSLPSTIAVQRWARRLALLRAVSQIRLAGVMPEASEISRVQRNADAAIVLPFELARRFGNWRVDHSCIALRLPKDAGAWPDLWWRAVGQFDVGRLRAGLQAEGLTVRERDGAYVVSDLVAGLEVEFTAHTLAVATGEMQLRGAEAAPPPGIDAPAPIWLTVNLAALGLGQLPLPDLRRSERCTITAAIDDAAISVDLRYLAPDAPDVSTAEFGRRARTRIPLFAAMWTQGRGMDLCTEVLRKLSGQVRGGIGSVSLRLTGDDLRRIATLTQRVAATFGE